MLYVVLVSSVYVFVFVMQKTAYDVRISDWSSDVCSSDRLPHPGGRPACTGCRPHLLRAWRKLSCRPRRASRCSSDRSRRLPAGRRGRLHGRCRWQADRATRRRFRHPWTGIVERLYLRPLCHARSVVRRFWTECFFSFIFLFSPYLFLHIFLFFFFFS